MATWVTHLAIADQVMAQVQWLDRRGFCVGNIAPDCNVENEDWTAFRPPREITHWMSGETKQFSDCDRFYQAYIQNESDSLPSGELYSFLLGYYAHLLTDAAFQQFLRDEQRVQAVWDRIHQDKRLSQVASGYPQQWESVKQIISKEQRLANIQSLEAAYLEKHPDSGYLTEILPLKKFPDYLDYLPSGAILRKIRIMGYRPTVTTDLNNLIFISRDEYSSFVNQTIRLIIFHFNKLALHRSDSI